MNLVRGVGSDIIQWMKIFGKLPGSEKNHDLQVITPKENLDKTEWKTWKQRLANNFGEANYWERSGREGY